jgi:hypothetical protein
LCATRKTVLAASAEFGDALVALDPELRVARGQRLVDEQDVMALGRAAIAKRSREPMPEE